MNKQSIPYTIIYIVLLVLIVGTVLVVTSLQLKDRQNENVKADKMLQILLSVNIEANTDNAVEMFEKSIVDQFVVNSKGERVDGDVKAFDIDVAKQITLPADQRLLPVYVCRTDNGNKYILSAYGAGLWGPIWGYISLDDNGSTVYGAYFAHQGETPGLGAEIEKPFFRDEFKGKNLFKDGQFLPIAVMKKGQKPADDSDYVDAISGGTITSKGVSDMIDNCLSPYKSFLETIRTK
ncbi:MAG: NADH:ubiquinone reductase (Na(+)-transporting) subunit C [Bacteroides sp.]|nr:NADH:ubiquinone reductase (Na(+)-transporting) subunit C [Bacteroides sp.]MCM1412870.1 NADH:ubiquinone reductase (Na(+)-transporting) subunit C [Bacteroides sp.]MCM1471539.1 NADH:ubiquinone reductase (Na(+)-transporting) subunit C [Bacteroides sp.]